MNDFWKKENYTHQKPKSQTATEIMKTISYWNNLHKWWKERLGEKAFQCPKCNSKDYNTWCKGWWPDKNHYHDPNRKECQKCGHWWWIVCPTCGYNKNMTKEKYFAQIEKYDKTGNLPIPLSEIF